MRWVWVLALAAVCCGSSGKGDSAFGPIPGIDSPADGELVQVVTFSRHGVRTPLEPFTCEPGASDLTHCLDNWTKRPGGWPQDWNPSDWPNSKAGDLTKVGTELATLMGGYYGSRLSGSFFAADKCPSADDVFIRTDVAERTIATGRAIADGFATSFAAGCTLPIHFLEPAPKVDPLFHPATGAVCSLNLEAAQAKIMERLPPGGLPAVDEQNAAAFGTLQNTLDCCQPDICMQDTLCTLAEQTSHLSLDTKNDTIKVSGALGFASTASELFLLEYANGFPEQEVGWGVVTVPAMAEMLTLHNVHNDYAQRTLFIAASQGSMLLRAIRDTMTGASSGTASGPLPPPRTKLAVFVGHDTNIDNLAAMLHTDWPASEQLPDKTAPGGALLFEVRKLGDVRFVRLWYVAQSVDQLRNRTVLSEAVPPLLISVPLPCDSQDDGVCTLEAFSNLVDRALDPACLK